jgi:hypothetical protein
LRLKGRKGERDRGKEIKNSSGFATTRLGLILGRSPFLCFRKALQHLRI